jgi:hypothetical protein
MAETSKTTAKAAPAAKAAASTKKKATGKATPAVTDGPKCSMEKCKQPMRAKGYCRKHFIGWRRGEVGKHHHYKICSKEGCRKPRALGGLCEEHSGKGAPAEGAAA